MEHEHDERELRAARNQAMFRNVNEKMRELNEAFGSISGEYAIACECADPTCVQTLTVRGDDYMNVRANPRRFVVLPGHVYPDIETVVSATETHLVVEKLAKAGEVVADLAAVER